MSPSDFQTDTTRRFHRTIDSAFPFGPSYGNPIQGPYRRGAGVGRALTWASVVAGAVVLIGVIA